jgi:hypothetical protein
MNCRYLDLDMILPGFYPGITEQYPQPVGNTTNTMASKYQMVVVLICGLAKARPF